MRKTGQLEKFENKFKHFAVASTGKKTETAPETGSAKPAVEAPKKKTDKKA